MDATIGHNNPPSALERARDAAAGTPFLFKQWGEWAPSNDFPSEMQEDYDVSGLTEAAFIRVGKALAGRLLDGVEHNAFLDG